MIRLTQRDADGNFPRGFAYCHGWNIVTRLVLPYTRYLRALHAERYMPHSIERHLDVGCGDGYFLLRSRAVERWGLDQLMGDKISDLALLPREHFDCVTMLAVIEHLEEPREILEYIWPVMKPGGRLIITTPRQKAEKFIRLYVPNIALEHERYFDEASLRDLLAPGFTLRTWHSFIFGLNQAFCFERLPVLAGAGAIDATEEVGRRETALAHE